MAEAVLLGVLIVAFVALEAFFSGAETGIISVNRVKLRHTSEHGDPRALFLHETLAHPDTMLACMLVGTNLSVVASTALAATLVARVAPDHVSAVTSVVMIPLHVIFAEIIPKAVLRRRPMEVLLPAVPLLRLALWSLGLPARAMARVSRTLVDLVGVGGGRGSLVTREELRGLIEVGGRDGTLAPGQQRMLRGAFSFAGTSVRSVMIPLTEVVAVPEGATAASVLERARRHGYYRFPVYRERVDQVVGVVNVSDLLFGPVAPAADVASFIRTPLYLPNTVSIDQALLRMQRSHEHMAVVVDEYGGCDGLVTVQDIIETVVGELDTSRPASEDVRPLGPGAFEVSAQVDLERLNDALGVALPKANYETLAGFLLTRFGRIPRVGEQVVFGSATFEILEVRGPAIVKVHVRVRK